MIIATWSRLFKERVSHYPADKSLSSGYKVQSNLFVMDTKGTGISVPIIEVSILEKYI